MSTACSGTPQGIYERAVKFHIKFNQFRRLDRFEQIAIRLNSVGWNNAPLRENAVCLSFDEASGKIHILNPRDVHHRDLGGLVRGPLQNALGDQPLNG